MDKIEKFDKYLQDTEAVLLFDKTIENDIAYYKSCYENKFGEFTYIVIIYPTPVVEVLSNVIKVVGDKAREIVLTNINELNRKTKGIKYFLDERGNVGLTHEFIGPVEEFDPEKVVGTAVALFRHAERDLAQLIIELQKEKNKNENQ